MRNVLEKPHPKYIGLQIKMNVLFFTYYYLFNLKLYKLLKQEKAYDRKETYFLNSLFLTIFIINQIHKNVLLAKKSKKDLCV